MAVINPRKNEMVCKLVYYGTARSGKTTNLTYISNTFKDQVKGEMVSINTGHDKTLFFDFLPMELGRMLDFDIRVQLYTVPGQVQYATTRKLVLRQVDAVVFVADSLKVRRESNHEALIDLDRNLRELGMSISRIPLVMQFNKRDLEGGGPPLMSIEQMERDLNRGLKVPTFAASAINGRGVTDTLKEILKRMIVSLRKEMKK